MDAHGQSHGIALIRAHHAVAGLPLIFIASAKRTADAYAAASCTSFGASKHSRRFSCCMDSKVINTLLSCCGLVSHSALGTLPSPRWASHAPVPLSGEPCSPPDSRTHWPSPRRCHAHAHSNADNPTGKFVGRRIGLRRATNREGSSQVPRSQSSGSAAATRERRRGEPNAPGCRRRTRLRLAVPVPLLLRLFRRARGQALCPSGAPPQGSLGRCASRVGRNAQVR